MKLLEGGLGFVLTGLTCLALSPVFQANAQPEPTVQIAQVVQLPTVTVKQLPPEARTTIQLIDRGGPFPYRKDGTIFGNRERRLPQKSRDYYREYTVPTPGLRTRGARRIITGQGRELYYTGDHYRSFVRVIRR